MLVELICLWKIPDGSLRLVITATPQDASPRVLILKFFGPLPHISYQVHHREWACAQRVRVDRIRTPHGSSFVRHWHGVSIPCVSPWIHASIRTLCRILPLPFMRQTLSRPRSISSSIFKGHPRHRLVVPAGRIRAILPIPEEVQIILRMIMSRLEKLLKLCVGDRIFIDPE